MKSAAFELCRVPSGPALSERAAAIFVDAASEATQARGAFKVALSGGSTPLALYSLLADAASLRSQVSWAHVHFFWGDERHVPPAHPDSNYRMAYESLLARVPIDPSRVWRIKGEYPQASQAADEYERDLRRVLDPVSLEFDLVLLGMGTDGHTASLFPGTAALHEHERLVVANRVEMLDTDRITLTSTALSSAAMVLFLVKGAEKAAALKAVLEGPHQPDHLPAQLIRPRRGRLLWLVDSAAASLLSAVDGPEETR